MLISQSNKIKQNIYINKQLFFKPKLCRIIAGPCATETRDQTLKTAYELKKLGISIFRAGAFKPRTDPYSFQGSQEDGLKWLEEVKHEFDMKIITETTDMTNFKAVADVADIIQIGAKAMYNHALLRSSGLTNKPVLLKRHYGATVEELLKMSDYIAKEGNLQIMLCERGIRTFETSSRFTLDLCGAASIKKQSKAPLILDPSHSMGYNYGVPDIACACIAFGCSGLLIEVHNDPSQALCDKNQALDISQFKRLYKKMQIIGDSIGIKVS